MRQNNYIFNMPFLENPWRSALPSFDLYLEGNFDEIIRSLTTYVAVVRTYYNL